MPSDPTTTAATARIVTTQRADNNGPISPAPAQEVGADHPLDSGHSCTPDQQFILDRLTVQPNGCWFVQGTIQKRGYCQLYVPALKKTLLAHRIAYEAFVGPIPEGYQVDHVCHNLDESCPGGFSCLHRRCCNPEHLEAKTGRDNNLSGKSTAARNAVKVVCKRGHDDWRYLTDKNGKPFRKCRECARTAYGSPRPRICPHCGESRWHLKDHIAAKHPEVVAA